MAALHHDSNCNIMLDLECIAVEAPNPVLIELGATHFDFDTGEEYSYFKTPISLQSCLDHGLQADDDTTKWVERNIPETLATSKTTKVTLEETLYKLSLFIRNALDAMKKTLKARDQEGRCQVMVWGNGAVADNIWIRSAYAACGMTRPWMFYQDACVRTFVNQAGLITNRNFPSEVARKGKHHDALDDCRHQVKYLVLARDALISIQRPDVGATSDPVTPGKQSSKEPSTPQTETLPGPSLPPPKTQPKQRLLSEAFKKPETSVGHLPPNPGILLPAGTRLILPPETSILEEDQIAKSLLDLDKAHLPPKRKRVPMKNAAVQRPGMLPSPDTSFSSADGEAEDLPGLAKSVVEIQERFFMTKIGQAMKRNGLLSPETSFYILEDDIKADLPSPSPEPKRFSDMARILEDDHFDESG